MPDPPTFLMLVCTVGGSPEPIAASMTHWRPSRVLFLASEESVKEIEARILPLIAERGFALDPGKFDTVIVGNGQDFGVCVSRMQRAAEQVRAWTTRGPNYRVMVDFTGGTKLMSAALALHARHWPCEFSYVGGTERSKNGLGVVVTGREQILRSENPWEVLGFQSIEDAFAVADRGAHAAAAKGLEAILPAIHDDGMKRKIAVLKSLLEAYAAWDRFDHKNALNRFKEVSRFENDLRALFGLTGFDRLAAALKSHREHLTAISTANGPRQALILDLLANARRRADEERFEDAVARLYRAIEAFAQARLAEAHQIPDTARVPLDRIPEPLKSKWAPKAREGYLTVSLQDAYVLLGALQDPVARRFVELELDGERSPLVARNQSILAHGFTPTNQKVFEELWERALKLMGIAENDLPSMPRLCE